MQPNDNLLQISKYFSSKTINPPGLYIKIPNTISHLPESSVYVEILKGDHQHIRRRPYRCEDV